MKIKALLTILLLPQNFLRIIAIIFLVIVAIRKFDTDLSISATSAILALLITFNVIRAVEADIKDRT